MDRILRRPEVERTVGLSRSAIYAAMDRGTFPKPIRIGQRAVGWPLSRIEGWLRDRPDANGWKSAK
jgi:prophage regulatory protein